MKKFNEYLEEGFKEPPHEPRTKKHFVHVVRQFNNASKQEHEAYMIRNDKKMKHYQNIADAAGKHFMKHYRKDIPIEKRKGAKLHHYDTSDPVGMAHAWGYTK